jgi:hypothetical protein|tara:strand:+ start:411 stop:638 length:228 start_codon:yes stop_codon:yes gene_type:complete
MSSIAWLSLITANCYEPLVLELNNLSRTKVVYLTLKSSIDAKKYKAIHFNRLYKNTHLYQKEINQDGALRTITRH